VRWDFRPSTDVELRQSGNEDGTLRPPPGLAYETGLVEAGRTEP
jgi:hypothetical protein